jgi:hypothetical protein
MSIRWRVYRPRTVTERHVSNSPSSDTPVSEIASVLEENISVEAKYVGLACSGSAETLNFTRFLTAHLTHGLIIHFISSLNQVVIHELTQKRAVRVQAVSCSMDKPPLRPKVLNHIIVTDFVGDLLDALNVKKIFELVSISAMFATTEEIYYRRFADSVIDFEAEKEGVIGQNWVLVRIKQIPICR